MMPGKADKPTQNSALQGISEQENFMIRVLFICHGNILKSLEKACKINRFTKQIGTYYTTTTPVSLDVTKILRSRSSL